MPSCRARLVHPLPVALLSLAALLVTADPGRAAAGAARAWTVAPAPAWVRDARIPEPAASSAAEPDRVYLLVDHQVRLASDTSDYLRLAWTPRSTAGLQNASEIQIRFDPSYERLVIHHLRVLRGGRDVFGFSPGDVRVIQPEADLDAQIYSGELSAVIFLRDLRVGDVVDYAYSLTGSNPILAGGFDDEFALAYDLPVRWLRHVLHAPSSMTLHVTARHTALTPAVETRGGITVRTWEARDVPALVVEEDEPGWFDPDPRVEISTFGSWADVARWASGLFDSQLRPSRSVTELAERFRGAARDEAGRLDAAVRFVQDEIRYLGIEMGPSSHLPHPPEWVLERRFGDCKDKALLLVALLRELGIDAAPALVDTERRRGLDDTQPSAFAFDHAIVQARLGGRTVWIDATESNRGGHPSEWLAPEFERALVLRPDAASLTPIPVELAKEPLVEVNERFTLQGATRAILDVITTFRGTEADYARQSLATLSPRELSKRCLDAYAKDFSDISVRHAPAASDDRDRNLLTLRESYAIGGFWKAGERELTGWKVEQVLPDTAASTRTAPLSIPHPVRVRHIIRVAASSPFRLGSWRESTASDEFAFAAALSSQGPEMRLEFEYASRLDAIAAGRMRDHQHAMDELGRALSFVLRSDLTSPDAPRNQWQGWPVLLIAPLAAGLGAVTLWWRRRLLRAAVPAAVMVSSDAPPASQPSSDEGHPNPR